MKSYLQKHIKRMQNHVIAHSFIKRAKKLNLIVRPSMNNSAIKIQAKRKSCVRQERSFIHCKHF